MGWSCTDKEMDAIERLPTGAWTGGIDQNGDLVADTSVADLTGMLDLDSWQDKIPILRIIVCDEPLHPRYRKRATDRERQLGRRYQLIATTPVSGRSPGSTPATAPTSTSRTTSNKPRTWTWAWTGGRRGSGRSTWPGQIVALAANLLACLRHL